MAGSIAVSPPAVWTLPRLAAALLLLSAAPPASAADYEVSLETPTLTGTPARVAFDLVDGYSAPAGALITGFTTDGTLGGTSVLLGGATGVLPAVGTLFDAAFLNELAQPLTLGTNLRFRLSVSGVGPAGSPDQVAFFLLDAREEGPLPLFATTDPTGSDALFAIDLKGAPPSLDVYAAVGEDSVWAVALVPEVSSFAAAAAALAALAALSAPRRRAR